MRQYKNQYKQRQTKKGQISKVSKSLAPKTQSISNDKPKISSEQISENTYKRAEAIIIIQPNRDDLEKLQLMPAKMTQIPLKNQLNDSKLEALEKSQGLKQCGCKLIEQKKMDDNYKNCPNSQVQSKVSVIQNQSHSIDSAQSSQQFQTDKVPEMIIRKQTAIQNVEQDRENAPNQIIEQQQQPQQNSHAIEVSEAAFESFCLHSEPIEAEKQSPNVMIITEEKKEPQPKPNQNHDMPNQAQQPQANRLEQPNHVSHQQPDNAQCKDDKSQRNQLKTKNISKSKPPKRSNSKRKDSKLTQTYHCHCNSRGCQDGYCGCHRQGMWCSQMCLCSLCTNIPHNKAHPQTMRSNPIAPLELFDGIEEDFEMDMSFGVVEFFNIQQERIEPMVEPFSPMQDQKQEDQKAELSTSEPNVVQDQHRQSICSGQSEIKERLQEKHQLKYQYDNSLT